jgi:hypothetical protein
VVGSLTSIVTEEDANAQLTHARMDAVQSYLTKMKVPEDLSRKVRRHFRNFFANKSSLDESTIFTEMSTSIRTEATSFLIESGPLSTVALFKAMPSAYWGRVLPLLRPVVFLRDEVVCGQGDEILEAYIVTSGGFTCATLDPFGETEPAEARRIAQRFHKRVIHPDAESAAAAAAEHIPDDLHLRECKDGGVINQLIILKVWSKCLETVQAGQKSEAYAINGEVFEAAFGEDPEVCSPPPQLEIELLGFWWHGSDNPTILRLFFQ